MNATLGKPALRTRKLSSASAPSSSGMRAGCTSLNCRALLLNCNSAAPIVRPKIAPPRQLNALSSGFSCASARQCTAPFNASIANLRAPSSNVRSSRRRSTRRGAPSSIAISPAIFPAVCIDLKFVSSSSGCR